MDRLLPARRPDRRNDGTQKWRDLLFIHFEVPAALVRPLVPAELELDLWEGTCQVGVVPFAMHDVLPRGFPRVPGVTDFLELNVRTYVHSRGDNPGVWFMSLEAASTIAVYAARLGWSLPYHRASMSMKRTGDAFAYDSRRLFPGPTPATFHGEYTLGREVGPATAGSFEHFLAERYLLYASRRGALLVGQVHHVPYPLFEAKLDAHGETLLAAAGIAAPSREPFPVTSVLFSPGVDVEVFALRPR